MRCGAAWTRRELQGAVRVPVAEVRAGADHPDTWTPITRCYYYYNYLSLTH